jgi:hypothetical protein
LCSFPGCPRVVDDGVGCINSIPVLELTNAGETEFAHPQAPWHFDFYNGDDILDCTA